MHYDEEPLRYRPYVPGKVVVGRGVFFTLCAFAALGILTLVFIVFA